MRLLISILLIGGLMSFQLIGAGSDLSSTQTQVNKNILELKNNETTTIFKDDTGTRRVLLGKGADGFYGVKVSPEGTDVYTAGDDDLVFNSNQNVFKIVATNTYVPTWTISITTAANQWNTGGEDVSIPHGLSYIPAIIGYVVYNDEYYPMPYTSQDAAGGTSVVMQNIKISVDATNVIISHSAMALNFPGGVAFGIPTSIKYYLLQETAN